MAHAVSNGFSSDEDQVLSYRTENDDDLAFFSSIDTATQSWLNSLHYIWGLWKKSEAVTKTLTDYFNTAPNPYLSTLRIIVNTTDFNYIKTRASLAFTVVEEFSIWLSIRRDEYKECLTPDLKIATFRLISKQKNMQFTRLVSEVYEFEEQKELFLPMIEQMLGDGKYKEVAQYAAMLNLQSHFAHPEILLLPLILQSKLTVVEDFLVNCPEIQMDLVMYLDNLLAPGKNMQSTLETYISSNKISDVKMSTIQVRPMTKLVGRLTKLYNLSPDVCPNLNQRRGEGALQFLMYKRYVDCSLAGESWNEMVREAVGTDPRLHLELTKLLVQANDVEEALGWAKYYNIPKEQWPWSLVELDKHTPSEADPGACGSGEENWDVEEDPAMFHVFNLPRENIKVLDNPRSFEEFLDKGLKGINIVGIDSEWKPSFGTKRIELALIQIATLTNVYILDVTTMGNEFADLWTELGLVLFENKNIIKLGFGLAHDVAMMRDSLPALSNVRACGQGYLDLLHLWRKLTREYKFVFPYKGDETFTNESLSKLVELCMGRRLNKSDQFSNWERRPLRESQMIYAALDAYCLLEVYDTLQEQCERMDIPFYEICAEVQHIPHKSPKKQSKKSSQKSTVANSLPTTNGVEHFHERQQSGAKRTPLFASTPAHDWRVVCDSMLGGLARQLRMCGCDSVHVEFDRGGDQSAKVAIEQDRVLLTRGGAYHKFAPYVQHGSCYKVLSDKPEDQLKDVLSHFNILVRPTDIFSRCQICNHDEFAQISRSTMNELCKSFSKASHGSRYSLLPGTSAGAESDDADADYDVMTNDDFRLSGKRGPAQNKQNRTWQLSNESLDVANCRTKYRVRVQLDRVPVNVLRNVQRFYICEHCGKVYWDGSHLERALNSTLRDVIVWE